MPSHNQIVRRVCVNPLTREQIWLSFLILMVGLILVFSSLQQNRAGWTAFRVCESRVCTTYLSLANAQVTLSLVLGWFEAGKSSPYSLKDT